ncbi:MAG: HigA family addiction module antidote protein [bacterium]|nr:HigA family addiction module antidote protein [bacterium]
MTDTRAFKPDWVSAPGETIEDLLEERGWTQAEFADRTGFTRKHVNDLVKGRASITPGAALRLEAVLGSAADFWLTREAHYREALERRRSREALHAEAGWLRELPLAQMVKLGWVRRESRKSDQVAECLRFFGVASVATWRRQYEMPLAAFRASKRFEKKIGAVAAWLRQGELGATALRCGPYQKAGFKVVLNEARTLTNEPNAQVFVPRLVEACAARGVAVVFVPAPTGCPVSGATRWLTPEKAVLILSLRHKTNDHLWFTFFHEAAHLLLHSKKMQFVDLDDRLDGELEQEADRFARDWLIPPTAARRLEVLGRSGRVSKTAVARFAAEVGVAPGIVVGRMQKEDWLPWTHLNGLKVRYEWAEKIEQAQ